MDAKAAAAHLVEVAFSFDDTQIPSHEAAAIDSQTVRFLVQRADEETRDAQERESRQEIRERYGDDRPRPIERANQFLKAHPTLDESLTRSGMVSHPSVVLALAERAKDLRITSRRPK